MHTRHKWGKSERDLKHRRYGYQDVRVRTCSTCDQKVYGVVYRRVVTHYADVQNKVLISGE